MESRISQSLNRSGHPDEVLADKFRLQLTRRDIQTLSGLNWLNDEVMAKSTLYALFRKTFISSLSMLYFCLCDKVYHKQ